MLDSQRLKWSWKKSEILTYLQLEGSVDSVPRDVTLPSPDKFRPRWQFASWRKIDKAVGLPGLEDSW